MNIQDFFKWWTVSNLVWQIVGNFLSAGGPSPNPVIVSNEVMKELNRKVSAGYLPEYVLDDAETTIKFAIDSHPGLPLKR